MLVIRLRSNQQQRRSQIENRKMQLHATTDIIFCLIKFCIMFFLFNSATQQLQLSQPYKPLDGVMFQLMNRDTFTITGFSLIF